MDIHPFRDEKDELFVDNISFKNPYDFYKAHRHSYYEIFLFEKGVGGTQMIDFETYTIESNTLFIVSPNQVHLLKRERGEDGLLMQFTADYLETSINSTHPDLLFALKEYPYTKLSDSDFEQLSLLLGTLKRINDSTNAYKKEKLQHLFAFAIYQIIEILQCVNHHALRDTLCIQFQKMAENNFIKNRDIGFYVEKLNVSKTKLYAQVKSNLGITPLQYLHELLKVEIRRLILIEQLSHKQISHYLGFDSQSSYTRFVKKQMGCNPNDLSRSLQKHK